MSAAPRKVAALYDIHGNLPALEAVLDEMTRADIDHVVVGGDVVPGPMTHEVLERLLDLDVPVEFIQGNCEVALLAERAGGELPDWYRAIPEQFQKVMRWNAERLRAEDERAFASWPRTLRVRIEGIGEVLFCHATPRHENEIFTRLTPEERLLPIFEGLGVPLVICGHTHMQFDRAIGTTRVVNTGSVGMPFGEAGADWLVLGPDAQLRHTAYDLGRAAERIRATDYVEAHDFAARYVLQPPTEASMLEAFTAASLR